MAASPWALPEVLASLREVLVGRDPARGRHTASTGEPDGAEDDRRHRRGLLQGQRGHAARHRALGPRADPRGLGLVLLDDGSSDGGADLVAGITDPRVRLIRHEANLGTPVRLNQLTHLVDTPYLARMDGDDLMHPERLARSLEVLHDRPDVSFVAGHAVSIDRSSRPAASSVHGRTDRGRPLPPRTVRPWHGHGPHRWFRDHPTTRRSGGARTRSCGCGRWQRTTVTLDAVLLYLARRARFPRRSTRRACAARDGCCACTVLPSWGGRAPCGSPRGRWSARPPTGWRTRVGAVDRLVAAGGPPGWGPRPTRSRGRDRADPVGEAAGAGLTRGDPYPRRDRHRARGPGQVDEVLVDTLTRRGAERTAPGPGEARRWP